VTAAVTRSRAVGSLATGLAIPMSALAVASPPAALGAAAALGFVATAFVNLSAAVGVFAALTFFALIPGVGTSFVSVVKLAGAVILLALGRRQGGRTLWRDQPLLAWIATALGTWAFASMAWAGDASRARSRALTLALTIVLVFVVYAAVGSCRQMRWLVHGYVGGAVASGLVGLVVPAPSEGDTGRLTGGVGDPNELALVLVPALALAVFALPGASGAFERTFLGGGALVIAVAIFQTGSRGGLVGLAVASVVAIAFGGRLRGYVAAGLCGLAAAAALYFAFVASPQVSGRVLSFTSGGGSGRTDIWAVATQVARDHPFLGVGVGNFPLVEPSYASRTANLEQIDYIVTQPQVVHNSYLELLAELGVVGLVFFAALVAAALSLCMRAIRAFSRAGDVDPELIARGLLVGLAGMLAASFFLSAEYEKQLWLLVGLCPALARMASLGAAGRPNGHTLALVPDGAGD